MDLIIDLLHHLLQDCIFNQYSLHFEIFMGLILFHFLNLLNKFLSLRPRLLTQGFVHKVLTNLHTSISLGSKLKIVTYFFALTFQSMSISNDNK